jgi:hypothetical protein
MHAASCNKSNHAYHVIQQCQFIPCPSIQHVLNACLIIQHVCHTTSVCTWLCTEAGSQRPVLLHSTPAGEDAASALTHAAIVLGHRQAPSFVYLGQGGFAAAEEAVRQGRREGSW